MKDLINHVDRPVQFVGANWEGDLRCPKCGSRLWYAYPGVVRTIEDLERVIKLLSHYYLCSNIDCPLHKPFRAPQPFVLPYKKFSRAVQEKIIRAYYEVGSNSRKIKKILGIFSSVTISPQTITRYLDDFIFLQSESVNQTIATKIKANKTMIIYVDGQRPKRGASALWNFGEILTGEQIHAEYLKKADTATLGAIFLKIEQKYQVKIEAVVSDHQKSIVNAVKRYLPNARHQFCHFHFLNNLSEPLKQMDSHLHAELEYIVNHLYINTTSMEKEISIVPGFKDKVQSFFKGLNDDLHHFLQYPSRSFDIWGSLKSYHDLTQYCQRIEQEFIPFVPSNSRIRKILSKVIQAIQSGLEDLNDLFKKLQVLVDLFEIIRDILGTQAYSAQGMQQEVRKWYNLLKVKISKSSTLVNKNAAIKLLSHKASIAEVCVQWQRLYQHHRTGLFMYLLDPRIPRTNTGAERDFSQEVTFWRGLARKSNVNYHVHVKGDFWLKTRRHYSVPTIQDTLSTYSLEHHQKAQHIFGERRKLERLSWRCGKNETKGLEELKKKIKHLYPKSRILSN